MAPPLPDNLWFPVAAGITDLPEAPAPSTAAPVPANAIPIPSGFDAANPGSIWELLPTGEDPVFAATISPASLVPVVVEEVKAVALVRLRLLARSFPYALSAAVQQLVVAISVQVSAVRVKLLYAAGADNAVSGQAATLRYTRAVTAGEGSFAVSSYGAGSIRDYRIGTNYGSFTATGQNAIVALQRAPLAADAGSFALSGQAALFSGATTFPAEAGSFAVTGQAASSIRSYVVSGAAGSLSLAGQAAALNKAVPVVLLLHMDGANNSTTFTDSSSYGRTVTPAGSTSAYITTAQSKFGGASGYFVNAPYLQIADATELHFGGSNFTVEAWVRLAQNTGSTFKVIAAQTASSTSDYGWNFYYNAGTTKSLNFRYSTDGVNGTTFTSNTTLSTNIWYHVAAVRNDADLVLYVNGTQVGSTHNIGTDVIYNSTADLTIGASNTTAANFWYGYIDELRISAVAQYTANFTAPTAAFPDP